MERTIQKEMISSVPDPMVSSRCSQCGSVIHDGRELIVNEKQLWCDGCYRLMLNPDSSGDIPSRWY